MTLFADTAGERLDAFLARQPGSLSRSAAQRLIEEGMVTRNGVPGKKNDRLNVGDRVEYTIPEAKPVDIVPTEMPLDIVYEDDDLLVINKPKGLVVHPAAGHADDTLVNGLLYALGDDLSGINGELRPGIVHRIDKDTSGLLAVAKNDYAHTMLASQLKDHTMARTYEAIVCGVMKEDCGTVDAPIGRHPTDRKKMCVTQRGGRNAVTHWEVVRRYKGYPHPLQAGNRPHPPDPGTHGLHWPPHSGGHGLRPQKAGAWAEQSVPPRRGAVLPAPPGRTSGDGFRRAAPIFPGRAGQAGKDEIDIRRKLWENFRMYCSPWTMTGR